MAFQIVRNDITKMNTEAIVNTASARASVGSGCDSAVYQAAGYEELLRYRKEKIGFVPEGGAFITPGFALQAKYIIHAVSPLYTGGGDGEEEKLRSCYRESLRLAKENGVRSIAFPLISTGGFGYPKEEGMRIAVDEIHAFLLSHEMDIVLVVFDERSTSLGGKLYPDLKAYIDRHYVDEKRKEEYGAGFLGMAEAASVPLASALPRTPEAPRFPRELEAEKAPRTTRAPKPSGLRSLFKNKDAAKPKLRLEEEQAVAQNMAAEEDLSFLDFEMEHEGKLAERMSHISDTFSQYLLYLIQDKKMRNAEVYKRAIVDKKIFSKIKNNVDYHPQKLTALCLCVGAKLNLDESKDLLARAGYALSPCDKTDIIFSYFIENQIYDMIELDIQLEEHGLPCIIS